MTLPNFALTSNAPLSLQAQQAGISDFHHLVHYVHQLAYGRISNKQQLALSFVEKCGTCSSKHALLCAISMEENIKEIELALGIYKMNAQNTPPVGHILQKYTLEYLPEAHNYLRYQGIRYDLTFAENPIVNDWIAADLLEEQILVPHQINAYKVQAHRAFLDKWLIQEAVPYSLDEIWTIREACIHALMPQ